MDGGHLEPLFKGERWEDARQPSGQHALAGTGGADEQEVVAARGGDFDGASGQRLAAYISEIRGRCGRRSWKWLGWDRSRATSRQDGHGLAERRDRDDVEARDDRGFPGVGMGEDDATHTITTRLHRDREDASHRSDRAIKRQLAEDDGVVDLTGGDETGRCQHPERDR